MTIYLIMSIGFAVFAAIMFVSFLFHKEEVLGNTPTPPVGGAALPTPSIQEGKLVNVSSRGGRLRHANCSIVTMLSGHRARVRSEVTGRTFVRSVRQLRAA